MQPVLQASHIFALRIQAIAYRLFNGGARREFLLHDGVLRFRSLQLGHRAFTLAARLLQPQLQVAALFGGTAAALGGVGETLGGNRQVAFHLAD
ncbi:MAG: hypothetical protein ABUL71_01165, partial [Gemmatimonadota bacterium]